MKTCQWVYYDTLYVSNKTFKRVSNNLMKLLRTELCSLCTNHEKYAMKYVSF